MNRKSSRRLKINGGDLGSAELRAASLRYRKRMERMEFLNRIFGFDKKDK